MARRIIGAAFLSLDGVMQAPGGPSEDPSGGFQYGGWLAGHDDEAIDAQIGSFLNPPFDLLLGRRTWEIFAAYWPFVDQANPVAAMFARCGKYVLTRSDRPLDWQGSHRLADIEALAALKASDGPDLLIQGSSTLYPPLLACGLIDRLVLTIAPVLLGGGKRLFGPGTPAGSWKPVKMWTSPAGTVMATLAPGGPVATGTIGEPPEPSAAEQARQAAISEGTW